MLGLTRIQTIIIGAALIIALIGGAILYVFNQGKSAGSSAVKDAVQDKTIQTLDAARARKERADEETRRTPYGDRVDGLR